MGTGTIVFVHGTGVRLKGYKRSFADAESQARAAGIKAQFVECPWGDLLGIEFKGLSLPGAPTPEKLRDEEEELARWSFLFADPLFELDKLTIRDPKQPDQPKPPPGKKLPWQEVWDKIKAYEATHELQLLLKRGDLQDFWTQAWADVVESSKTPGLAFERSSHQLAEATNALARALVADLHVLATAAGKAGPDRTLRGKLLDRLLDDWGETKYAVGTFLSGLFKRAASSVLRRHRNELCEAVALPVGDIFLYLSRGEDIRNYIRDAVVNATPPVTVIAHSLGGIASFDLLASPGAPEVARLVTVGSQSPLMYEIDALPSLKKDAPLPKHFPDWLNILDRNDFLSFSAKKLFKKNVEEFDAELGQPFPDSHSAYFGSERVWERIKKFGVK
jgi:hypothetical protein